ncbi:membrane protein [Mycobacterium phage Peterson]|nr:membrane protein [Mycobacterium phage Peterson]
MNTILRNIAAAMFVLIAPAAIAAPAWAAPADDGHTMGQSSFPCEEDEVLGYDPSFGPDRVGCLHIGDVR